MIADHPFRQEARIILNLHIVEVTGTAYLNIGMTAARSVLDALFCA
jgi:hypothetical protein